MEALLANRVIRIDTRSIARLICPACGRDSHGAFRGELHRVFCECGSELDADAVHAAFCFDAGAVHALRVKGLRPADPFAEANKGLERWTNEGGR